LATKVAFAPGETGEVTETISSVSSMVGIGVGVGVGVDVGVGVGVVVGVEVGGARGGAYFSVVSVYFCPSVVTTMVPCMSVP